ncbi:hypothetical protein DXG03_000917 [Asterophora parasitica]|uniref:Uncharacterized protein n=1 Tax=Asterophora parasitica TaxID=117018 RepID=A0A9P7G5W3_9AGAR|nr:hypothetical protein DXG03_000917 [Asterophora parasitica]
MERIKKIRTKMFKKSSAGPTSRRDPTLMHSRSMPLRNSNDTEDSYLYPRPIYHGELPLQPGNIEQVIDISQAQISLYDDPYYGWPGYNEVDEDDDDQSDFEHLQRHRFPVIDKATDNSFPVSPTATPAPKPKRPARPPTLDLNGFQFNEDDLLPDMDPVVKAKLDAMCPDDRPEAPNVAVTQRAAPLQRTLSSASGYVRPLNVHRHAAADDAPGFRTHADSNSSSSLSPDGPWIYRNPAANNSTRSLGPRAYMPRGPPATPTYGLSARPPPSSTSSIYGNAAGNKSTQSLAANARYRAALAESSGGPDAVPIEGFLPTQSASVRRRNASSASSRSVLFARRACSDGSTSVAPTRPVPPTPLEEELPSEVQPLQHQLAHQTLDSNHHGEKRIVRGLHGSAVDAAVSVRPGRDSGKDVKAAAAEADELGAATVASGPGMKGRLAGIALLDSKDVVPMDSV